MLFPVNLFLIFAVDWQPVAFTAMVAVGLSTRFEAMRVIGVRPFLAGTLAAALVGGVSLDDKDDMLASVLLDLSQTATVEASTDLADKLLGQLKRVGS